MAKIKVYCDEHVSYAIVRGLRQRGCDVLSVADAGMLGASDEQQLALAREERRVVFTQDVDFLKLHKLEVPHAGIVYAPHGTPVGDIIRGLLLILDVLEPGDMTNHVEFI